MKWLRSIAAAGRLGLAAILDVVLEDACVICGRHRRRDAEISNPYTERLAQPVRVRHYRVISIENHPVCIDCANGFVRTRGAGRLGHAVGSNVRTTHGAMFGVEPVLADPSGPPTAIPIVAPFMIDDAVLRLIHLIKFSGYRELVQVIAGAVTLAVDLLGTKDREIVVPVPMLDADRRRRGFNLPDEIAGQVAEHLCIKHNINGLEKIRPTTKQSTVPEDERAANVRGASRASNRVSGRPVLLIDDLVTTGATAGDCSAALKSAGAASVRVACFGRAL